MKRRKAVSPCMEVYGWTMKRQVLAGCNNGKMKENWQAWDTEEVGMRLKGEVAGEPGDADSAECRALFQSTYAGTFG